MTDVNWAALRSYLRAASGSRVRPERPAAQGSLPLDIGRVRAHRARAMHLDARVPSLADAAYAGLQDSAPRSALLSLHARADDVDPDSWEHPSLAQIWFRSSDYVVPRAAIGAFTIGAMPRDPQQAAALQAMVDLIVRALDGKPRSPRDVIRDAGAPVQTRASSVTGRIHIRWDASRIVMIPVQPPDVDEEDARRELLRRFLHWYGPANVDHFAKWAAVTNRDARTTWDALDNELLAVDFEGRARHILAADEAAFEPAGPCKGVRLLPLGDPYLFMDPHPAPRTPEAGPDVSPRLINSLWGRVLVGGEVVGSFGRVQAKVTVFPWTRPNAALTDRIEVAIASLAGPLAKMPTVRWLA